jgi:hypothetical protein
MNEGKKRFWEEVGAYCRKCGYDKSIRSLHCHHLDPSQKEGVNDTLGVAINKGHEPLRQWCKRTRFIILCANCHGELHDGYWKVPEDYLGDNLLYNSVFDHKLARMLDHAIACQKDDGVNRQSHHRRISLQPPKYVPNYII